MTYPSQCQFEYATENGVVCGAGIAAPVSGSTGAAMARGLGLTAEFRREGPRLDVFVTAHKTLTLTKVALEFPADFSRGRKVLLNGYQSWTSTFECKPAACLHGIDHLPAGVVDYWVLDGSGDYRFADYSKGKGQMHGWTFGYTVGNGHCELFASLDESHGFTKLSLDVARGVVILEPELPACALKAGERVFLGSFAVLEASADDVDGLFERWFELMSVRARTQVPLCGYSSWYRHYGDIDEALLARDLQATKLVFDKLDTAGFKRLFQIDDGYCKVGDWTCVNEKFPSGLQAMAQWVSDAGFIPGLWMAPFVAEIDSELVAKHPDWILEDEWGTWTSSGSHWSGGVALDTLNPEVRDYVRACIRTVVDEWGFRFLKLDFLYAACMIPHGGMNRGQLLCDALNLLREAAGPDVLIDGCGVPLASAFGVFDYCRIGCDVGLDWNGVPHMQLTDRERVSTRNSVANTVFRAPLNGRAFLNDPDVVFLRGDVKLEDWQRQDMLDADACMAGMLLTSDDVSLWDESARERYQRCLDLMRAHLA